MKRLAASFEIAGRDRGLRRRRGAQAVAARRSRAYREAMRQFAGDARTSTSGTRASTSSERRRRAASAATREQAQARSSSDGRRRRGRKDSLRALAKLTEVRRRRAADRRRPAADRARSTSSAGRRRRDDARGEIARSSVGATARTLPARPAARCSSSYRFVDLARKVVGVGSVGTRCWIVLLLGRDDERSALPAGQGGASRRCSSRSLGAERVREPRPARGRGPAADAGRERHLPRLGRTRPGSTASARDFYVRQLWDWKASVDLEHDRARGPGASTRGCAAGRSRGRTRARATAIAIAAYLGKSDAFDHAIARVRRGLRRPERARLRRARRGRPKRADDRQGVRRLGGRGDRAVRAPTRGER